MLFVPAGAEMFLTRHLKKLNLHLKLHMNGILTSAENHNMPLGELSLKVLLHFFIIILYPIQDKMRPKTRDKWSRIELLDAIIF